MDDEKARRTCGLAKRQAGATFKAIGIGQELGIPGTRASQIPCKGA